MSINSDTASTGRRAIQMEGWLISYGLLGLTQNGLLPILLPLAAPGAAAGITYAAFSFIGLFSPMLGSWADRTGRHRDLLIWGSIGSGLPLLFFNAANTPWRIAIAATAGFGAVAAMTVGNVLAIQDTAEAGWDSQVARLQRFISAGQVIGLVLAGVLAHSHPAGGFIAAGIASIAAGICGLTAPSRRIPREPHRKPEARPMVGGDAGAPASHHHGHRVSWQQLAASLRVINLRLRRFLIVWLIAYPAMNGVATIFPVAMTQEFGLDPVLPSSAYAIGVALSLLVYAPAGLATARIGGGRILASGLAIRCGLLAILASLGMLRGGRAGWLILVAFALIQLVWPLLSVAANSLSVRLAPEARGESLGLFNAATSLSAAAGSVIGGAIFGIAGSAGLAAAACAAVAFALALALHWVPRTSQVHNIDRR